MSANMYLLCVQSNFNINESILGYFCQGISTSVCILHLLNELNLLEFRTGGVQRTEV
jgi:hypothetical protein